MSAIVTIPFNFQPVQTVVSTASYTVPAGKYAKVHLANAVLPILNAVNMYVNRASAGGWTGATVANQAFPLGISHMAVHRLNFTSGSATWQIGLGTGVTGGATTFGYQFTYAGTSGSYTFGIPTDLNGAFASNSGTATITGVSFDVGILPNDVWLKAGDVLTYTSGNIVYTEYTVIA